MLKLNKKVEYGIIILNHFYRNESQYFSAKDLTTAYGIPHDVCSKILQVLKRGGILISQKGVGGGYSLDFDLSKLSIYELQMMILGQRFIADCLFHGKDCDVAENCSIVKPVMKLNKELDSFFKNMSVKNFLTS